MGGLFSFLQKANNCDEGLLFVAVTTCLTFELVEQERGTSTLEEGMLFLWLIDWLTPPSPFPTSRGPARQPCWVICHG